MGETSRRARVCILGATGSIGRQALDVCAQHAEHLEVVGLAAGSDAKGLMDAARRFDVRNLALAEGSPETRAQVCALDAATSCEFGARAVEELAGNSGADVVVVAIVGAAAIAPTLAALKSGARVALANKECLVAAGSLVTAAAAPGQIIPVDSEHSAIFQCLQAGREDEISRIWLTCSGGPFRGYTRDELSRVSAADALRHPTWNMGPKITIDSADLMNKGLEVIEATWLFGVAASKVAVLVHPQSLIHSMVEFEDGETIAQLGAPDMRGAIQYAMSYPERWEAPAPSPDWREMGPLTFDAPDLDTFRCLGLAMEAAHVGGTMPAAMNAANEIANAAFRAARIRMTEIDEVVEVVMDATSPATVESLEQIFEVDARARRAAEACVEELAR